MKIVIKIHLNIEGNRIMKSREFAVRKEEDIPNLAYEWFQFTKLEIGHRETIIDKVTWNVDNDITDEVRGIINNK